jgi:hypothetical protein
MPPAGFECTEQFTVSTIYITNTTGSSYNNNNNNNNNNNKGATVIILKSFRKYVSNIPGNHEVKELQKTAILGTAHILRKVLT